MFPEVHWWVVVPASATAAITLYSHRQSRWRPLLYTVAWLALGLRDWFMLSHSQLNVLWWGQWALLLCTVTAVVSELVQGQPKASGRSRGKTRKK